MSGDSDPLLAPGALPEAFARALKRKSLGAVEASFIDQVRSDWRPPELAEVGGGDLAIVLAEVWRFAEGASVDLEIRLTGARGRGGRDLGFDLVQIVQEDRPFLVDSVMAELNQAGLEVRAMFHPVVTLSERQTSLILIAVAPVGEDRRAGLLEGLRETLADVRAAVDDLEAMTALTRRAAEGLKAAGARPGGPETSEDVRFLEWLPSDHFVFLGARIYDYPRSPEGGYLAEEPRFQPEASLGVLRDSRRSVLRRASEPALLAPQLAAYLRTAAPLVVAKSNLQSRVHRRAHMDYIGVRRYGEDGAPCGEIRLVGLFTSEAYDQRASEIPLVRRTLDRALARLGRNPSEHTAKRLRGILETYPRDELFQIDEETLSTTALGVLHLYDRPRVRLFARRDTFDRFVSVLLYVPRDRYDSAVVGEAGELIAAAWRGRLSALSPNFSAEPLARVHFVVGVTPGDHADPDLAALEAAIAERVRTWGDRFENLIRSGGAPAGTVGDILSRYAGAFPAGYRDQNDAEEALVDIGAAEGVGPAAPLRIRAYRRPQDPHRSFRFKLYHLAAAVPLADVLPILENMGLKAMTEDGFPLRRARGSGEPGEVVWVHEFTLDDERGASLVFADVKAPFENAFQAVWEGRAENDGFNRLVIELGVSWREASLIRALARYRQQSGLDPTQSVQTATLSAYPGVARLILDLFMIKFSPAIRADLAERTRQADAVLAQILSALQSVESLDADRVLRRLALLTAALVRTNFYQNDAAGRPKLHISFKIASQELADLPAPRPYREIFVCSPQVEGVHLRFGPIARGGLRWSDRRDDFRTEVLGLVKAQQVKNAVIVPVGAKGGFYPKLLQRSSPPEETRAVAVEAYKTYLHGLLDITDTLDARGRAVRPANVVAHEADDPYLVVAADKGTASFSDIANGVAEAYGFWLGDAFASGGSAGYDHKAMGITARGAWEAVKRHFRERGKDIQIEPFTCIGVGDMSGDVFGNGALLSRALKLVAAFDHRHIFLDPAPDGERSWRERRRLFDLPRSSWADYDPDRLSPGGGVFARTAKTAALTPQIRQLLGVSDAELAPTDLIRAILKADVELLYLGGIGTYVKAASESHVDVGDKANDAVRIDAGELRVQVVAEGANLGVTQQGRIAFARAGGRIDTDAIDNSAGVDTSDHEVNIKILTGQAERSGALKRADRDPLLFSMTEAVASRVLSHTYAQTLALSLQEASASADLDAHGRFMLDLEAEGRLDRKVEGLPRAAAVADLKAAGRGLSRPELAVLTAYGKLELSSAIVASDAPDDPAFEQALMAYFPSALAPFDREMKRHRLRREIIATMVANAVVDLTGPTFAPRLRAAAGCTTATLVVAFEAARRILRLDERWALVSGLDLKAPAAAQIALYRELADVLRGQTFRLARLRSDGVGVQILVDAYRPTADALTADDGVHLSPFERAAADARAERFQSLGAPPGLSRAISRVRPLTASLDIADLARQGRLDVLDAASLYHGVGEAFGFERLRSAASSIRGRDPYERQAVRELLLDLLAEQSARAAAVMRLARRPTEAVDAAIAAWSEPRLGAVARARGLIEEIEAAPDGWSFAKLTICNAALKSASAAA